MPVDSETGTNCLANI